MLRLPVNNFLQKPLYVRSSSSSSYIRSTFIDFFKDHNHKVVRSSPVVPLCDPTVPFVNAGMNQFKGVFLGNVDPPYPRVVNSQKCIRVGGKHNDLDIVGTDGHHHTFFEMLGNWSFGDYYKKDACQMAWDLLLGPYRLKPENLVVTYFAGDPVLGLIEDRECRDVWRVIGVATDRLIAKDAKDNFWEMGLTGPCGPCTEIHYVNQDGSLTEIWNIVFLQCNRNADGKVTDLQKQHIDTGMGLERMTALLQGKRSNYDTDLFTPIIRTIQTNSKSVDKYSGKYGDQAKLDTAYRRLADHARMISICLADSMSPATSVNLKQMMRKSFKISADIFNSEQGMLQHLYEVVEDILSPTYPELSKKKKEAKLILEQEENSYRRLRADLKKKWKNLAKAYPEVEGFNDVELTGFAAGYTEFRETMAKLKTNIIPGELVFKLYDELGFKEDLIQRIAGHHNMEIDNAKFWRLLKDHKMRHKTAFKEQTDNKGMKFKNAIDKLITLGRKKSNDQPKYNYTISEGRIKFDPLRTKLTAILNHHLEWLDASEPSESKPYYLVTEDTNFYCEEGGQIADLGKIVINKYISFEVESVFKIRDFVFHKGYFSVNHNLVSQIPETKARPRNLQSKEDSPYVVVDRDVNLIIDIERRLNIMRNHTAVHLLNAALRKVLCNSVVSQIGSKVTDLGLSLNLSVYGEKLTQDAVLKVQELVRQSITSNSPVNTSTLDSVQLMGESDVVTVPGETYPEVGLRMVSTDADQLLSKELCCGTHVPSTGHVGDFCVTLVKGASTTTPAIHCVTGDRARQVRELFCRVDKIEEVIHLVDSARMKQEAADIKQQLANICGTSGAPFAEYAVCLAKLEKLVKRTAGNVEMSLDELAKAEVLEACDSAEKSGSRFIVHFLRCSYMAGPAGSCGAAGALAADRPALLLGCADGLIHVTAWVPEPFVTSRFTASKWLSSVLPVFGGEMLSQPGNTFKTTAEMKPVRVSLINCEQLVQDAIAAANLFAETHTNRTEPDSDKEDDVNGRENRSTN